MTPGNLGFAFCAFSQVDRVCMSLTSDEIVCDKEMNKRVMDLVTCNLLNEIAKMEEEKKRDGWTTEIKRKTVVGNIHQWEYVGWINSDLGNGLFGQKNKEKVKK